MLKQVYKINSVLKHSSNTLLKPKHCFDISTKTARTISTSNAALLKKIEVTKEGNVTTIEGKNYDDYEGKTIVPSSPEGYCPMCPNKLGFSIDYTDVLIISQFVRADGRPLPQRATGLCEVAQNKMREMIHKAQRAGLMPEKRPLLPYEKERTGPNSRYKWKKYNTYYNPGKLPYEIPY